MIGALQSWRAPAHRRIGSFVLALATWIGPVLAAWAGPRDDLKMAYIDAAEKLDQLDIEGAIKTLDDAIGQAKAQGLGEDPALAPLHAMRGGLIFSNNGDREATVAALVEAVKIDYNVSLPIELRSAELKSLLDEARSKVQRPGGEALVHRPPGQADPGADLEIGALANQALPDNAQMVLYWRRADSGAEFTSTYMDLWGNFGTATVTAQQHGGQPLEYFFYVFDADQKALANLGDQQRPMRLQFGASTTSTPQPKDDDKDDEVKADKKRDSGKHPLPRLFIYAGVGTGFGIARGTAELTYQQYTPNTPGFVYDRREQACAIERWRAGGTPLSANANEFITNLNQVAAIPGALPAGTTPEQLAAAYDPDYCNARHPVTTGLASAPLHVNFEFGGRIGQRIVMTGFTRLQVLTGSKVFAEDANKNLGDSFIEDVRNEACSAVNPNACPQGVRRRHPFTFAVGLKVKYFLGKKERKFRVFVGGFAGYGQARFRVPMGLANDRNGNSVPDTFESQRVNGSNGCVPVWPYNGACPPDTAEEQTERDIANGVRGNTPASEQRIDTVKIGPGFVGAMVGFHYQIVRNFGLYGEFDVGGWFPYTSSLLFDITVGPMITFDFAGKKGK